MRRFLFFLVVFFFVGFPAFTEESRSEAQDEAIIIDEASQFGIAQHFFDEEDYFRSITEYRRFIYYFPHSELLEMARFKIGEAYFKGKEWKKALQAFEKLREEFPDGDLVPKSHYLSAMAYSYQKDYRYSREQFGKIPDLFPKHKLADNAKLQIAMSYVEEKRWGDALASLRGIEEGGSLYTTAQGFASGLENIDKLPLKSPALAGTFAAILPGSGHLYTGRTRDGTIAFLLNTAFIWGAVESFDDHNYAVGGILTFFGLGWYFGNIYSAVSSTHKYNDRLEGKYIRNLKDKSNISLGFGQADKLHYIRFSMRF